RSLQLGKAERGSGSEGKDVIQQRGIHLGRRVEPHFVDLRFGNAIPVFQRRLEVTLQEIYARHKIVAVRIGRIKPKRASQIVRSLRIVLLLEKDSGQLQRKSFVVGLLSEPVLKSSLGFIPAFQAKERYTVAIVEISGALSFNLCKPNDLLPPFFREESFDLDGRLGGGERSLRPEGKGKKGERKKDGCRLHWSVG